MAINVPNAGIYQQNLGVHVVQFRDALQALLNDAAYLTSMGGQSFLTGQLAMTVPDAQEVMNTIGAVTPENSVVQQIQAFIASTEPLWGGQ